LLALLALTAAVSGSAGILASHGTKASADPPPAATLAALASAAYAVAAGNGDAHAVQGQVVASTRREANLEASGADLPDTSSVYVVSLHGRFTAVGPRPLEATAPQGPVLTLVFDRTTLEVVDLTISQHAPVLSKLGTVVALPPQASAG
jgi:hypothetical protein